MVILQYPCLMMLEQGKMNPSPGLCSSQTVPWGQRVCQPHQCLETGEDVSAGHCAWLPASMQHQRSRSPDGLSNEMRTFHRHHEPEAVRTVTNRWGFTETWEWVWKAQNWQPTSQHLVLSDPFPYFCTSGWPIQPHSFRSFIIYCYCDRVPVAKVHCRQTPATCELLW